MDTSLDSMDEGLESSAVLAAVQDVTIRRAREEEQRRNRPGTRRDHSGRLAILEELVGGTAHDFNNLLGIILNYTALLTRGTDEPRVIADLAEIRSAAEHAAALSRQLLTFARRDKTGLATVDINGVITDVVSTMGTTVDQHIGIRLDVSEEPMTVPGTRLSKPVAERSLPGAVRDALDG